MKDFYMSIVNSYFADNFKQKALDVIENHYEKDEDYDQSLSCSCICDGTMLFEVEQIAECLYAAIVCCENNSDNKFGDVEIKSEEVKSPNPDKPWMTCRFEAKIPIKDSSAIKESRVINEDKI